MSDFQGHLEYTYKETTYLIHHDYNMWITTEKESAGEVCQTWGMATYGLEDVLEELRTEIEDSPG